MRNRVFVLGGRLGSVAAMAAVVMAACAFSRAGAAEKADRAGLGSAAPDFSLTDQGGKTVHLSDYAGKFVVLEWTNPECPFVRRHYKEKTMTTLSEKYKDKGVVWLAINSNNGETPDDIRKWAQSNQVAYAVLNDAQGTVAKAYDAKSTPHLFVIDKEGKLAYKGAIDNDADGDKTSGKVNYVEKALDELLAGKSVSTPETKSYGCHVEQAGA